ncbi:MAG: hypothetical protein EBQ92_10770 [Proteobacteria bacterium]|nr:hypothetical protein [Pseudomonadota bacterium]
MPLINPVYGLPNYTVDRLSESEGRNRQRERKKDKKEEETKSEQTGSIEKSISSEEELLVQASESSQVLDTETVVKLLDTQVKNQNQTENQNLNVSNCYDHVKNLTGTSKLNREI